MAELESLIYIRCHADLSCTSFPIQIDSPPGETNE